MALTATATQTTRNEVVKRLCMNNPVLIYLPPTKSNIIYAVKPKPLMEDVVHPIVESLRRCGPATSKMLIYCRRYDEVASMYEMFKREMREEFTSPPGAPNLSAYRLVDMYSRCTDCSLKELIVARFVALQAHFELLFRLFHLG